MFLNKSLITAGLTLSLVLALACSGSDDGESDGGGNTLMIGALLPMTGSLASYGEGSNAALAEAVTKINAGSGADVELAVEDTRSDPSVALEKLRALQSRGVRLVIGPYSSSEVVAVKAFADQNNMLLLSPLSTATSLQIANDSVFRFTPDDEEETRAVAQLALADGVRVMITLNRDDEGNRSLAASIKKAFEAAGGRVVSAGTYGPNERTEADFRDDAQRLTDLVAANTASGKVGIYLAAFGEVPGVLDAAATQPSLRSLLWYGSNSVAQINDLIVDKTAAAFAASVGYPNPILGVSDADRSLWAPVTEAVQRRINRAPSAFALAAYDALMVGYAALTGAGANADAAALKQRLVSEANGYSGLTGSTRLNESGDRALANYDFWSVCPAAGDFVWKKTLIYAAPMAAGSPPRIARVAC